MQKWEKIVDRLFQEAIGDGDVSHLSGSGKPLRLDNDSYTPAELRAAHKILDDHNVIPDWIANRKLLDQVESKLQNQVLRRAKKYRTARQAALKSEQSELLSILDDNWKRFEGKFIERAERYNRDVLNHNLTVPHGIPHKPLLNGEEMIKRALGRP